MLLAQLSRRTIYHLTPNTYHLASMHRLLLLLALTAPYNVARAQATSLFIEDLTWPEIRQGIASGKTTAILYIGSTEQNGPHMATGKHNFVAHYVAGLVASKLGNALVYPTLPFAITGDLVQRTGHMRYPGSVSLTPQVYAGVVHDVALSAIDAGFKYVAIMGDHGDGQNVLGAVAKQLDAAWKPKGVRVLYVPDLYFKEKQQAAAFESARGIRRDVHAGTDDTSELMAIDAAHRWIRYDQLTLSATQQGAVGVDGDPTKASPALGRVFIGYKVDDAVAQIRVLEGSSR